MPYIGGDNVPGRGINALDSATNVGGESAGLQAVLAQLRARGVKNIDANAIRDIVNENARPPGDPTANGPNLGPVVLNLRNAGIEDASPMPVRGGGRTSAPPDPVPPIPPQQADSSPQPPPSSPNSGYIPTPGPIPPTPGPGAPLPGTQLPPGGAPVPNPSPTPMLPPPDAAAMVPQPGGGGPSGLAALAPLILGGIPLSSLLERARANLSLSGPRAPTDVAVAGPRAVAANDTALPAGRGAVGPSGRVIDVPSTALPAPPAQRALPAPATQPALPGQPARPALPAPDAVPPPRVAPSGPGFDPEPLRGPVSDAIDKAVPADAPAAPRAKTRARGRARFRA